MLKVDDCFKAWMRMSRMELSGRYSGITRTAVRDYSDDSLALSGISSGIIRTA